MLTENIKYLIKKNRLKVHEFGNIIKTSKTVAGSYSSGRALPKYDTLLLLSEKFNVTVDALLKEDISKSKDQSIGIYNLQEVFLNVTQPKGLGIVNEEKEKYVLEDYKEKYFALLEEQNTLNKKYIALNEKYNRLKKPNIANYK